jgi:hypothetical protein
MTDGGLGAVMAAFAAFAVVALVIALALYVYYALTYMTIARKLKTEPAWLAWVPIANIYLIWKMSQAPMWSLIVFIVGMLVGIIPFIGWILALAPMAMAVYWMWLIAERRKFPGWISLLLLVPVANLIVPGVLAWVDRK